MSLDSVYILAGGTSRRMGADKGLVRFQGKLLVEYQIELIKELGKLPVIVSSNQEYEKFGFEVIQDRQEFHQKGPLAGVETALSHSQKDVFILNVDSIGLKKEDLQDFFSEENSEVSILEMEAKGLQYLVGRYPFHCLSTIRTSLKNNQLTVKTFLDQVGYDSSKSNNNSILNVNSPKDVDCQLAKVTYFGQVKEILNVDSEFVLIPKDGAQDLQGYFYSIFPQIKHIPIQIAVNNQLKNSFELSQSINELSILPPFAGG